MTLLRIVHPLTFVCLALTLVSFASGCGGDADGEYRDFSRSEPAPSDSGNVQSDEPELGGVSEQPGLGNARLGEPQLDAGQTVVEAPVPDSGELDETEGPNENNGSKKVQPAKDRQVQLLVEQREFKTEGSPQALRVNYDDIDLLKVLNMEPVTPEAPQLMPDWLTGLDGKRIRIRGFMYPPHLETGIPFFVLARDNQICCFGRDPKIYDLIGVKMRDGITTDYIQNRPFDVVGVFRIKPSVEDGKLYQLYQIDNAVVIDKIR